MTPIINRLDEISDRYDAMFVDLWGCVHNGLRPFPEAVAALQAYRRKGGVVMLLTNSPRPRASVRAQLQEIGVPDDCYDAITSSGDSAQAAMVSGMFGKKLYHLGPERDRVFFTDMAKDITQAVEIELVPLDQAEGIVCTGLFDDRSETPEDYRHTILYAKQKGLKLLCANPDVIVDVGDERIYCAGAIAEAYTAAGGKSFYFGKPHAPIYILARARLEAMLDRRVGEEYILCIGDGINTDIQGGIGEGLDTLFICGGIAAEATGMHDGQPDQVKLDAFVAQKQLSPTAAIGFLR